MKGYPSRFLGFAFRVNKILTWVCRNKYCKCLLFFFPSPPLSLSGMKLMQVKRLEMTRFTQANDDGARYDI